MDERKILSSLKNDFQEAQKLRFQLDDYINTMRKIYKGENLPKNKRGSNFISKEVRKQVKWFKSQAKNPFVSNDEIVTLQPTLSSKNHNHRLFAEQTEKLVNYHFTKKFDRYNFIDKLLHVLAVEGTVVIRTGWEYKGIVKEVEETVYEIEPSTGQQIPVGSVIVEKEIPLVNKPTATICKNEDIFIDPTAFDNKEIQFIIHRREVRLDELKKAGIYKNIDKVEKDLMVEETAKEILVEPYRMEVNKTLMYNLEDNLRKKIYMYEYWGWFDIDDDGETEPIVCCWIGDTIVRLEENPYPDKSIPYIISQFEQEPYSIQGVALADILEEYQRIKTGIMRGIFDNLAQSNHTQKGVQKGNLDPVNLNRFLNGENFEFNISPNAFYQGQYNRIPPEVFKVLQDIDIEKQMNTGIMPMQGGQGFEAIYGSQAGKSGALNSLMLLELDMVTNIAENAIKPLIKKWIYYMYEFLEPTEIEAITNMPYVENDKEDIPNYLDDFTIDISTQYTNEAKASELAFLMQTLGNTIPFDMTKVILSKIAKLKGMPDLAQNIENYEPQPDPVQQQLVQIELQKKMLELEYMKAQIQAEMGKAQADVVLKQAKAKEAEAKATQTGLKTIKEKYGVDIKQKMQELQFKNQLDMQKLMAQAQAKEMSQIPSGQGIKQNPQEPINPLATGLKDTL